MLEGILTLDRLVRDLQSVAQEIASEALVSRGAGWIDQLKEEFPLAYNLLMKGLYDEPEAVLKALVAFNPLELRGLEKSPTAIDYVRRIQLKLRGGKQA